MWERKKKPDLSSRADMDDMTTSLFHLDIHLATLPWKPTAFWAGLAGVLLSWEWSELGPQLLSILTFLVLVDLVWGAWWRFCTYALSGIERTRKGQRLPYEQIPSPYRLAGKVWFRGFWTGMSLTTAIGMGLAATIGPNAVWVSMIALGLAGIAWWLSYVSPRWISWLRPMYGLGLPLWAGGYAFGRTGPVLLWASVALVGISWVLLFVRKTSKKPSQ